MKVLITGGAGFVAGYLAKEFKGHRVLLCDKTGHPDRTVVPLDITSKKQVEDTFKKFKPDQVYHLAAIPSPRQGSPELIQRVNVEGSRNILEACRRFSPKARVILVSTGYVYGECAKSAKESDALRPQGPYAKSKAEMEKLALKDFADLDFVIARPFNHTGLGQKTGVVFPDFAAQISLYKNKSQKEIETFDLDNERDFSHVKDVVKAYGLLSKKSKSHEIYNICSGKAVSIRKILNKMLKLSGIVNAPIKQKKLPHPLKRSVGSNAKIKRLGWVPKYNLEDILAEFVKVKC